MEIMTHDALKTALEGIFSSERIIDQPERLKEFSEDMTEIEGGFPSFAVVPKETAEIQEIVQFASKNKIPLTPRVAGTNLGGLALTVKGGIILDLREMNRIHEVNDRDLYAIIEPGVTFGQLKEYLDDHFPRLAMGYPLSPPYSSIVCNCILDGLGNLSMRYGAQGEWINGLEVVLANGALLRTGSWALGTPPFSRAPIADLTGLFVNWQGTTGIVVKAAIQLWPNPLFRERAFTLAYDLPSAFALMNETIRMRFFDDVGGISWPAGKMLFGVGKPIWKDPDEPEFFLYTDISGNTKEEVSVKRRMLLNALKDQKKRGSRFEDPISMETMMRVDPKFNKFAEFPMTLDFLLENEGGGLTWIGTYGPLSHFPAGAEKGLTVMKEYGFPPILVSRPMKGGHFGVLRFITTFKKSDSDEVARVRQENREILRVLFEEGFIPYKTPAWAWEILKPHMNRAFVRTMSDIRNLMDPKGILNPGKLPL
jgi:FAD/FMN-containing dehydrogenase